MLVVPHDAEVEMLRDLMRRPLSLHLFTNDKYQGRDDAREDYEEPSGGGYRPLALRADDWRIVAGAVATATYPPQTWRFTGAAGRMYGYFVAAAGGRLWWAERFSAGPFLVANPGDRITVDLVFLFGPRGS